MCWKKHARNFWSLEVSRSLGHLSSSALLLISRLLNFWCNIFWPYKQKSRMNEVSLEKITDVIVGKYNLIESVVEWLMILTYTSKKQNLTLWSKFSWLMIKFGDSVLWTSKKLLGPKTIGEWRTLLNEVNHLQHKLSFLLKAVENVWRKGYKMIKVSFNT